MYKAERDNEKRGNININMIATEVLTIVFPPLALYLGEFHTDTFSKKISSQVPTHFCDFLWPKSLTFLL